MTQQQRNNDSQHQPPERTLAEWVTFGIAALILLAIIGGVIYDWSAMPPSPPVLTIRQTDDVREESGQFYVHFEVENSGGDTAEAVQVIGALRVGSEEQTGEQQIDFLSGGETAEGAFVFTRDPAEGELELRVASYKLP
jgi:uncharacterized protein (TIGR02588 family)